MFVPLEKPATSRWCLHARLLPAYVEIVYQLTTEGVCRAPKAVILPVRIARAPLDLKRQFSPAPN
jgi:hypothetical protein